MPESFSKYLARRAEACPSGTCVACSCTDLFACPGGCSWERGTSERLCSAHTDIEKHQARAALRAADEARRASR